jgi:hypothetical protein
MQNFTHSVLISAVCFPSTQSTVNGFKPALPGGACSEQQQIVAVSPERVPEGLASDHCLDPDSSNLVF